MYVDPNKPLPNPDEREDYLGSVLNALINLNTKRTNLTGDEEEFNNKIDENQVLIDQKLDKFTQDIDTPLVNHEKEQGAVHGETKETIGLGKMDNWPMGNVDQHILGTNKELFANPIGLKNMIETRLEVDPSKYIRARLLPISSGGILGSTPQWKFDWREGEVIESFQDPYSYITETPWQFRSDSGAFLFPCMNGSNTLTQVTADSGRNKRACTQYGGANLRVYNGNLDIRRSRPAQLRGESNVEPNNILLRGSEHLFDKHSVFYAEPNGVGVRGFNRYRLPFDTLSNNGLWNNNWNGILEARENLIYNVITTGTYSDLLGTGIDLFLLIEIGIYSFTENGLDVKNGPGNKAETTAVIKDIYSTLNFSIPESNKIKILKRTGKPDAICIKLRDIISYTDAQLPDLIAGFNAERVSKMAFTWRNRLKGEFAIRIPVGFFTKDKSYYNNYYLDLDFLCTETVSNKSVSIIVKTLRDITVDVQTLNNNLEINKVGRFVRSPGTIKNDIFHPLIFDGIFEPIGGHIKTYTFYNRQYVGYYQHNVTSVGNWIDNGDVVQPVLSKYQYTEIANLNNDGLYGDHLRHIPLNVIGNSIDFLTRTRDWNHRYHWAIATTELDSSPELLTPTGHHHGPWREGVSWITPKETLIPSFVISNAEESSNFENTCLVFNTQNNFTGYGRYGYNPNADSPLEFFDETKVESSMLDWIIVNGGNWLRSHKQIFYFKGTLFWISQTLDSKEVKSDNIDGYYGYIKNVFIDVAENGTRVIKSNGPINSNAKSTPIIINTKSSLDVDPKNIIGFNEFDSTDVYLMLMKETNGETKYQTMINLAPFNNFYFEFEITLNQTTNSVDFKPNTAAIDPVFPYSNTKGFSVDYNALTMWGVKTPHQFHINYQSPVMLKKSMWSFRKTPGMYGLYSKSTGVVIVDGGLMNSVRGTPIYPVGSIITAGGANVFAKSPISAKASDFTGSDELFVRLFESTVGSVNTLTDGAVLYGRYNNPNGYEIEPNSGIVPCGFLVNDVFTHYDPAGWRNALLPVIDGKRLNFYGYGSSIPIFLGINGSGNPVNRFFLTSQYPNP